MPSSIMKTGENKDAAAVIAGTVFGGKEGEVGPALGCRTTYGLDSSSEANALSIG